MATVKGGIRLESALEAIVRKATNKKGVRVGFLENARYPDGTPVAMVAAIQNFGAPKVGIPPRPFFTNMVAQGRPTWGKVVAASLKAADFDTSKALKLVGEHVAGELRQSIRDTNSPALKPATVARKGFAKPLVDTGHMLNSVDYEVT
jgi:phage gpG-like protein